MSSNLTWEPRYRDKEDLPDELKYVLRKKYGDPVDTYMTAQDVPYLEGLSHADIKGVAQLLHAIDKHGDIIVKEEY